MPARLGDDGTALLVGVIVRHIPQGDHHSPFDPRSPIGNAEQVREIAPERVRPTSRQEFRVIVPVLRMSMVLEVVPPFITTRVDLNKAGDPIKEVVRPARLERSVVIQLMLCGKEIVEQNTLNDKYGYRQRGTPTHG